MSRKRRLGLLYRDAMTLLLFRTSLHPTLNLRRIARIEIEASTNIVEDRTQHADVAVDRPSGEIARTAAIMQARLPKVRAGKNVDLRPTSLAPMMQEAENVQWRSVGERSSRGRWWRTNRANGQKTLVISPQAVLLLSVFCVADEGA